MKEWFSVSVEGLKELQQGKPKIYIIRELIANAWDEQITECKVNFYFVEGKVTIIVEDDCPEGFVDLQDSFTLFKHTNKRADPNKRGRYCLGEKQSISICDFAIIETTKGTVLFNKKGRVISKVKRIKGSKITLGLKMSKAEFDSLSEIKNYFVPEGINFIVNGEKVEYRKPFRILEAILLTEKEENNILKRTSRKTQIFLHKAVGKSRICELGIPVEEINCPFDINIQQKVPLGIDRENILPAFLKDVFAEVLNCTFENITEDSSSDLWIRTAITDERIKSDAVRGIIKKRYGENACIANPFDKNSIDEAISRGYKIISGSEMSGEEWNAVKTNNILRTSSDLFGKSFVSAEVIKDLTPEQEAVATLYKKIAKKLLNINIVVVFVKSKAGEGANFDFSTNTLTMNFSRLGKGFFTPSLSAPVLDLCLHELAHAKGNNHTEMAYHCLLTSLGSRLVMLALTEPSFFKESE